MAISAAIFFLVTACTALHLSACSQVKVLHDGGSNMGICAGNTYARWREVCCEDGSILTPGDPSMQCCGGRVFVPKHFSCCNGSLFHEPGLSCCNGIPYNPVNSSCCLGRVTNISEMVSDCCESVAYNPVTQVCCDGHIHPLLPHSDCCHTELYDTETKLCCGHLSSRVVVDRPSKHHVCCGNISYNKCNQDCTAQLKVVDIDNSCQEKPLGSEDQVIFQLSTVKRMDRALCSRTGDYLKNCGWDCWFDPGTERCCVNMTSHSGQPYGHGQTCCEGNLTSTPGLPEGKCCGSVGYDPRTHICCGGQLSGKAPDKLECCGVEPYSVLDPYTLCCNGELYTNDISGYEGWECAEEGPYYPPLDTKCGSILYNEPGQHCCGHQTYHPEKDLCCEGHRWRGERRPGMECCGALPYDSADPHLRCCSGNLHKLRGLKRDRVGCCGTHLITDGRQQQCCTSPDMQLPYPRQSGFSCCGHFYYNASQHSCCAGLLRGHPGKASIPLAGNSRSCELLTLDNLKTHDLCNKAVGNSVFVGTVESMAVRNGTRHVALSRVLTSRRNNVTLLGSLKMLSLDHCGCPPLTLGRQYLWISKGTTWIMVDLSAIHSPVHALLSRCCL
ncbi:hypothetical protein AGOR_G00121660 [Albula goreensis]|uniref:Galaxin-like repeats domain-containing protein n=1 Tax=Albula goreensis TaxID=1534307 RepID=A0A8T3D6N0_9TELE|nr:hypothetical protein AGOR_G00121660 [Albula goreensis]